MSDARLYDREAWEMSDGRIEYFAPLPPSRRHQAAGRSGVFLYRCRGFFRDGRFVEYRICSGCGSTWSDEDLARERKANPRLLSCCPERKMVRA